MSIAQAPSKIISRLATFGFALGLWALASGCSLARPQELSYAGPEIQLVREFRLVRPGSDEPRKLFNHIVGLGPVLEWSPDGEQVLVDREQGQFYLADPETGELGDCLTCGMPDARTVHFSPDGKLVAIGDDSGLYLTDLAGGSPTKLADIPWPDWIDWSPDGSQIVFSARGSEGGAALINIYLFDLEAVELTNLTVGKGTENSEFFSPRWSPDGTQIAFHGLSSDGFDIMLIQPDGSNFRELTDWDFRGEAFFPGTAMPPQWSPDGERLAFLSYVDQGVQSNAEIFVIGTDGSDRENLTQSPGADRNPQWSSNGRLIAFVSYRDGDGEIYIMDSDGSNPTNVSNSSITDELIPFWRP
ncbi:MAG: hypothetical protein ACC700_14865 [Anaerolineales bacterium]